ncbi:MAG: hypothetical protein JWL90_2108 [Chthoniobacteraceae bacterium]|nr:hypothetical protein [Chthoniobacteraceae bacterium]
MNPPLFILGIASFVLCLPAGSQGATDRLHPDPALKAPEIFEQYCFDCHGEGSRKGGFALDDLLKRGDATQWEKVWKTVRQGFMPPPDDAERLPDPARKALTHWIAEQQLGVDYSKPDPGRVTMRRLNRMEYEFTVTDLFGVDLVSEGNFSSDAANSRARLRDMLPPDDTAFGFDNIGDFQTLSPALLEKYFNLAEFVVDRVILQAGPRVPELVLDNARLAITRNKDSKITEHQAGFDVAQGGKYRFEIQFILGGWQEYGGAYEFSLAIDGGALIKETVEQGGYKTYRFSREITLEQGAHRLGFLTAPIKPGVTGSFTPLELRPKLKLVGPLDAGVFEYPESHRRIFFQGEAPDSKSERREYARQIMKRVADRAFRRPAPDALLERLADLVMRAPEFRRGVGEGLMAILTSPKFLFRSELQLNPDDSKTIHLFDEFALASRIASLLWLSIPDEELSALAARGELRKNLAAQVRRMLADSKSARFFEDFPGQWLRTRNILMTPISRVDVKINPLREAMKRETEMLFEYIARNDRDLLEIVTANYSFLNRDLAKYYGVAGVTGDGFERVNLSAESKRGGILTQASFLISTSNPNRTSPVKRGLFVLENLLAIQPPPPPPSVAALDDSKADGVTPKSVREQLALHRADKSCAACHDHFDPIGIVLENYDLIGGWRARENGELIAPDEKTTTGQRLAGVDDLKRYFASRKEEFYRCASEKLLTYALGRGLEPADSVTVDELGGKLMADNGRFSTLLMGVIESAPFQMRRGDDGASKSAPGLQIPATPPPEKRKGPKRKEKPENTEAPPEKVAAVE